ncbi:tyrosine-type recombinase/integrase [Paenibacillus foliorum]|nr:site-specific integrase [Paenibacillus foliorum]
MQKNPSDIHPRLENKAQLDPQESFRQNFSFAEKILDVPGIFPTLSDDHDIKKVTREKVENLLYAKQLMPEIQNTEDNTHLGPLGINQWIWENRVLSEIPVSLLREFLSRGMKIVPHDFFKKYEHARNLLIQTAKLHGITPVQVENRHLLDPVSLCYCMKHLAKNELTSSLFHFLMRKSIQAGLMDKKFPIAKAPRELPRMHPRILSFKMYLEQKGFARKHVRNTITYVHQLFDWLCANVRIFAGTSPMEISVFQIQNDHLLAYRSYKMKLVKEGICSTITFTHCIYAIRSFYRYLKERFGYEPPLQRFRAIKAPRYKPRDIPTDQHIEAFFHVVRRYAGDPVREQIGYRLMLHLGLRLSEVAKIKWKDINLGTRTIVIHSKGKKTHVLPLVGKLYQLLRELQYQPMTTYLMGEKTSTIAGNLYEYFKLYAMITDWAFPGGVHLFRHTFITRLAHKGTLPQVLKELARVTMLDTVGLYIHVARHDQHMISQINLLKYE